jgi:hypothetical protein
MEKRLGRVKLERLAVVACMVVGVSLGAARGADEAKVEHSLKLVPADAAFYSTMLHNREQIEVIAKSKAWAKLKSLPLVQSLWKKATTHLKSPEAAPVVQFLEMPENKQLIALLADAASQEIYSYGGGSFIETFDLLSRVNNGMRFGPALMMLSGQGGDPNKAQIKAVLSVLAENLNLIKVPDLVFGFKISDKERAEAQLKRLEELLKGLSEQAPPLKGRVERTKVGDSSFLSVKLDGSLLPWDQMNLEEFESKSGQFDDLVKKLKKTTLVISLGIRGDYLLMGLGSSAKHLVLPQGQTLADRPEIKPLAQFADKKLISVGYVSKAFYSKLAASKQDIDTAMQGAKEALKKAPLPSELSQRIQRDLAELTRDLKTLVPEVGAVMGFSFLTDRGQESYAYDYGDHSGVDTSKPLSLLHHLGGDPLCAAVTRSKYSPEKYQMTVKWVKVANGYIEQFLVPKLPDDKKEMYEQIAKIAHPLLRRLDEVTGNMFLPALADGQTAFVVDAKVKSKQWFPGMPATDQPMPMVELALIMGVKDAALLRKAMGEYRVILNDAIAKAREMVPFLPPFEIPEPDSKSVKGGKIYYYPLPPIPGLDPQVSPNAGLSDRVAVLSFFQTHTDRLLADKPLKVEGGPLADGQRPLAGAAYINFAGLIEATAPWVEFGARHLGPRLLEKDGDGADQEDGGDAKKTEDIAKQVRALLDVLKVLRTYTSASYLENGVLVTHGELVIQDL